jgi:carnosine synthase
MRNIAEYSVNALKTGRIRDLDVLKKYQGKPDVLYANPLVSPGDKVGGS